MSGLEVIGGISAIIAIIDASVNISDSGRKDLKLSKSFKTAANRLTILRDTLQTCRDHFEWTKISLPADAAQDLVKTIESCKSKAEKLHDIFIETILGEDDQWDERYRKTAQRLSKGSKVEELMKAITEDAQNLVNSHAVRLASLERYNKLGETFKEIDTFKSAFPTENDARNNFISGGGSQYVHTGLGAQKINNSNRYIGEYSGCGNPTFHFGNPMTQPPASPYPRPSSQDAQTPYPIPSSLYLRPSSPYPRPSSRDTQTPYPIPSSPYLRPSSPYPRPSSQDTQTLDPIQWQKFLEWQRQQQQEQFQRLPPNMMPTYPQHVPQGMPQDSGYGSGSYETLGLAHGIPGWTQQLQQQALAAGPGHIYGHVTASGNARVLRGAVSNSTVPNALERQHRYDRAEVGERARMLNGNVRSELQDSGYCSSPYETLSHAHGFPAVGWICAVQTEYVVACELLDKEYPTPPLPSHHDNNAYTCGRMGDHNVVVACLPKGTYGLTSAATVARDMLRTFSAIRFGLMVGIGGGVPSQKHDIRLGDVVVSTPVDRTAGVIHYEFGKTIQNQKFERTGALNAPPLILLTALQKLSALHERRGHQIRETVNQMITRNARLKVKYQPPNPQSDVLYKSSFIHADPERPCMKLCRPHAEQIVERTIRNADQDDPVIHYGLIASADRLMKDAQMRDYLAQTEGVLCFEMEAAGLMDNFPCLVIRGICDYSDTHKNDMWQGYAAAAAAAYAKELLSVIPHSEVVNTLQPTSGYV